MKQPKLDALGQAIESAGGQASLAAALKLQRQSVHRWRKGLDPIPIPHVLTMERLYGIPRGQFRPDIYPKEPAAVK